MKRLALTAILSQAFLWVRQLRYERRLSNRQGRWEREADRAMKHHGEEVGKGFNEVSGILNRWSKEINREFRRGVSQITPGGARR